VQYDIKKPHRYKENCYALCQI